LRSRGSVACIIVTSDLLPNSARHL